MERNNIDLTNYIQLVIEKVFLSQKMESYKNMTLVII